MIGDRIKKLRKAHKLTQRQLASKLFVDASAITKWETGESSPSDEKKTALADLFNVTTDYLLGRTDDPTPPNAKKPASIADDGLTTRKKAFIETLKDLPDSDLDVLQAAADALIARREK